MAKRIVLALVSMLAASAGTGWTKTADTNRTLHVSVRNQGHVNKDTLNRALDEAALIFRRAGLTFQWSEWMENNPGASLAPSLTLIVLERQLQEIPDDGRLLLGLAPKTGNRSARIAYVFLEPIEYLSEVHAVDAALILAHAIAHELGHLLMPARDHASEGLMDGLWAGSEMRAETWGQQTFSREEADLIRAALRTTETHGEDGGHGRIKGWR